MKTMKKSTLALAALGASITLAPYSMPRATLLRARLVRE